ncbi:MAG: DNA alkylation repair protein [Muribaculaceae bacterium]|nr:DNA alkylation repair protein [Muribaculaceae bacterium]
MTEYNELQLIKRDFFAMRNGVIADNLRRSGLNYRIIFGLNLPQLQEIATRVGTNSDMALKLWSNTTTRESMLLAPMIFPIEEMSPEKAMLWLSEAPTLEIIDNLCHKLLRKCHFSLQMTESLASSDEPNLRYASLRLLFNLLPESATVARKIADSLKNDNCTAVASLAARLIDELDFIDEESLR